MTIYAPVFLEDVFQRVLNPVFPVDEVLLGFTFDVQTDNSGPSNNDQFTVPTVDPIFGSLYDATTTVDWGDGNITTNMATFDDARWTHTFTGGAGPYTVRITGTFKGFRFAAGGDRQKITDISQWGQLQLVNNGQAFNGCSNLDISATDILDITGITSFLLCFANCGSLTDIPSLEDWNFESMLSIFGMFTFSFLFNGTVEGMNIINVVNMQETFSFTSSFNQPVENLPTGNVTNFQNCFVNSAFNQPVNGLDTSSATRMLGMFQNAFNFDQPVSNFNTGSIANFDAFLRNTQFDQDLSTLDFSSTTSMVNFLTNVTLSTANYNAFLLSLDVQSVQSSVSFDGGDSTFDSTRIAVTSITSSGNVATATTPDPHGLSTSDRMVMFGAAPGGYNQPAIVTVTSPTTFTYPVAGPLSSPATGTITCEIDPPAVARRSLQLNDGWTIVDGGSV